MRDTLDLSDLVQLPAHGNGALPVPPHPIGAQLPGLYCDDDFVQRFTAGLDPVLATVFVALDNLEAYLDPLLTPEDFVPWLAQWVGIDLAGILDDTRRRRLVREAARLYGLRGTLEGLRRAVELQTGYVPEVEETGGSVASSSPNSPAPGQAGSTIVVRLRVPSPEAVDVEALDEFVGRIKPANVLHYVEVVTG